MPYLDHAATTPMLPEAVAAVADAMGELGNPSSLHGAGRRARRRVEESREQLAAALGARPSEVIFTAGGTEADNLAVKGIVLGPPRRRPAPHPGARQRGRAPRRARRRRVARRRTRAPSSCCCRSTRTGTVRPDTLRAALAADPESVALVSVMWANNEVGTVQPIAELAAVAHEYGIPFHTDAVQAVGALPVDFAASGVDALTMTGHKLGGPVGAGALLLRRDVACVAAAARRRPGARRPLRHPRRRRARSGSRPRPSLAVERRAETRRPARRRCATTWSPASARAVPDVVVNGHPDRPAARHRAPVASPAARATRC